MPKSNEKTRAGFVGLGQLGLPMVKGLLAEGFQVTVFDEDPERVALAVENGASPARSASEVASSSPITGVCVVNDEQVRDVVEGDDGLLVGASAGDVVVLHSTIAPRTCRELANKASGHGVEVLDAAMTMYGSTTEGPLITLVGGDSAVVQRSNDYLHAVATAAVFHVGDLGAGLSAKIAKNLMTMSSILITSEAMRLAEAAGIGLDAMLEIAMASEVVSGTIVNWRARFVEQEPNGPRFENVGMVGLKDINLAVTLGRELGIELPVAAAEVDLLQTALASPGAKTH